MTKAVFIVGNKRSGSTHLMRLLSLHPNVFVSNESDILWILYRFHNNLEIVPYPYDVPTGMNRTLDKYRDLLSKEKTPLENFVTIQRAIMEDGIDYVKPQHKENLLWIGDQKPFQQIDPEIVPFSKEHFPGFKFIHLIRHPFPVIRSAKVIPVDDLLWKNMSEAEILEEWTRHEGWVQLEKDKNEAPMLDVKYENIIGHTQREMARMFEFLGVTYDQAILEEARKITRSTIKVHPRISCPSETESIMSQYGYKTRLFWLEKQSYINAFNFLRKVKRKLTGTW
ncbi:MAG: hypothetical protein DRR00_15160 [Candidatus Parabeggiatoa sp. nov. 3]|nr:MAG: hypothetical protein DRR00_15160 [Gammaproteobacteria bacterium]RKZ62191.1 MAG: hypothetical protein DRQ99_19190 [Gammaproteobacteria bacterium]